MKKGRFLSYNYVEPGCFKKVRSVGNIVLKVDFITLNSISSLSILTYILYTKA